MSVTAPLIITTLSVVAQSCWLWGSNEIRQIIYSLYRTKEVTKKVYNNIMNLIKLQNRMDTIFMNSENSKTSDPSQTITQSYR